MQKPPVGGFAPSRLSNWGDMRISIASHDDDDRHHKGSMAALIAELRDLSVVKNHHITRDQIMQMYDAAMEKK